MIINKLVLTNIKSYVHEEFFFTPGINCILGLNGSGKSTIIESIGFAIFNFFKSKNLSQLLRYNETKGSIEVEFIANDDRLYRIIRNIRPKSSSAKIIDCETDTELYSNVADVYSFIKTILKVSKTKEFSKMFEEIIAVPQGQYVSAFLERPAERKENFDKLFELNIYKDLSNKLKDLSDYVKSNKVDLLKHDIDLIEGQLLSYDNKKEALDAIVKEIRDLKVAKENLDKEFIDVEKAKKTLEETKAKIEVLQNEINVTNEKKNSYEAITIKTNEDLLNAQKALQLVEENKNSYIQYQENAREIIDYEKQYEKMLMTEKQLHQFQNNIIIYDNNITNALKTIEDKKSEKNQRSDSVTNQNKEVFLWRNEYIKLQEEYQIMLEKNNTSIQEIKTKIKDQNEKIYNLKVYKNLYESRGNFDKSLIENNTKSIKVIEKKVEENSALKEQLFKLEKERITLDLELKNAIKNSQISIDGKCPFFKTECKNINEESLNNFFEKVVTSQSEKLKNVDHLINDLNSKIIEDKQLLISLQKLQNDRRFYEESQDKIDKLEKEFDQLYLSDVNNSPLTFADKINFLLEENNTQLNRLCEQENQINEQKNILINKQTNIMTLKYKITSTEVLINGLELDIKKLQKEMEINNNIINRETKAKDNSNKEIVKLQDYLNSNSGIKEKLDTLKSQNLSLEKNKNIYLSNIEKAKDVNRLNDTLKEIILQKDNLIKLIIDMQAKISLLHTNFSMDLMQEKINRYNDLIRNISAIKTSIDEKSRLQNDLQKDVLSMIQLFEIKSQKESELKQLNDIVNYLTATRSIYSKLPLELSKTYREYISHVATILYRMISHENVQINMLEDYQVQIIDTYNEANIKTMEQLSGGEQMSVAIAIRLSMLKHLSGLDIYFLDEPTINLDYERRERIAEVIQDIIGELSQLFVISHDDTFDNITDSIIKVEKKENISKCV